MKLSNMASQYEVQLFLSLTFLLSLFAFVLMALYPKFQSPESMQALPVWLVAVWSPTGSALLIWAMQHKLLDQLVKIFSLPTLSVWLLLLAIPLIVMMVILLFHLPTDTGTKPAPLPFSMIAFMIVFNLFLGPLGEEAGWRGLMFEHVIPYGWMAAALVTGVIWFVWHLPLWLIDSPQSHINIGIFFVHVICYAVLMSIVTLHANGSIIPAIVLHLFVNVITAVLLHYSAMSVNEIYKLSAYYYLFFTLLAVGLHELFAKKGCAIST